MLVYTGESESDSIIREKKKINVVHVVRSVRDDFTVFPPVDRQQTLSPCNHFASTTVVNRCLFS